MKILSRRTVMYGALIAAAISTAATTAVMIPTVSALAQDVMPTKQTAADREISPGMQALIGEFVSASILLAATDMEGNAESVGIVAQARTKSLTALAFHTPQNWVELAAKLAAITEFSEDTERFALRAVVEDATRLAQVAK